MNKLSVKDFCNTQFKHYAVYDSARSIAHAVDGQKITARKVIYTCVKKNIQSEMKVAQLASSVAFETAYHHGEQGIAGVICNLAQDFAGANNVNLLVPCGQFGSRLSPIPAAARYIFTHLSPRFREMHPKDDDLVLESNYEDGEQIEPKFYVPLLPMVLVNGSSGIGTGFASKVLSYNPADIKKNIIARLTGKKPKELWPWYNNYNGSISASAVNPGQWIFTGALEVVNSTTIRITELPIGVFLDDIKKTLNKLEESGFIKDYDDNSTEDQFNITVTVPRTTTALGIDALYDKFKLVSRDTENLTLWTTNGKLRVFKDAQELVDYFITVRLDTYKKRIAALIAKTQKDLDWALMKAKFIAFYLKNSDKFKNLNKPELIKLLETNNFTQYNELLSLSIWNLTKEKIDDLNKSAAEYSSYIKELKSTKPEEMYMEELTALKV